MKQVFCMAVLYESVTWTGTKNSAGHTAIVETEYLKSRDRDGG
jgi:hypothetical protein